MSKYFEKTNGSESNWFVYYKFIVNNFGNVHLNGCVYLAKACAIYARGEHQAMRIYGEIAEAEHRTLKAIERSVRTYVAKMDEDLVKQCLPSVTFITNKAMMAAIVHVVSKGGQHEDN